MPAKWVICRVGAAVALCGVVGFGQIAGIPQAFGSTSDSNESAGTDGSVGQNQRAAAADLLQISRYDPVAG